MKIIHSFWSLPNLKAGNHFYDDRAKGGWLDQKYNLISWVLSCLKTRVYYEKMELITDDFGKHLFIDQLGLPYTHCSTQLNALKDHPVDLWTAGKLYAYSLQEQPFMHIDGDVYYWEKFSNQLEQAPLFAQHLEDQISFYRETMDTILEHGFIIPKKLQKHFQKKGALKAVNAGIIGGNHTSFIQEYAQTALEFAAINTHLLDQVNVSIFGVFIEQFFFHALAEEKGIPIHYYDNRIVSDVKQYQRFNQFYKVPHQQTFVHMLGSSTKKDIYHCESLELRLRMEYPEYYYRILDYLGAQV